MSLNFDPEDWIATEYLNGTDYFHCNSGLNVTDWGVKYALRLDNIVIYRCEVLSQEDIDFCIKHAKSIKDNVTHAVNDRVPLFNCKLCKKDFVGEVYWHFRANHDSFTKSANKT